MFIIGNFFIAIAEVLSLVLNVIFWLILVRALISWVNPDPFNPIVQFLYRTTDPLLEPIRRRLPLSSIDLSPIIVWIIIVFLQSFLIASLKDIGYDMRQHRLGVQTSHVLRENSKDSSGKDFVCLIK